MQQAHTVHGLEFFGIRKSWNHIAERGISKGPALGYKLQGTVWSYTTQCGHSSFTKGPWKTAELCRDGYHPTVAVTESTGYDLFGEKLPFAILGGWRGTQQKSLRR